MLCGESFVPVVALKAVCLESFVPRVCAAWLVGGGMREKILPASVVCVLAGIIFSLLALNGLKWVFFAVRGEFCTGGRLRGPQREFCRGICPCALPAPGVPPACTWPVQRATPHRGPIAPAATVPYPWPVSVRYTRNRFSATMTAAMRKPVARRGRLFA